MSISGKWGSLRRGWRDQKGTAAVEFALLAMPFFFMVMGAIEMALSIASGVDHEGAAASAGRLVRTGQAQLSSNPQQAFEDALCDNIGMMIDCGDVQYEVINMGANTFASAEAYAPVFDSDGNLVTSGFSTGNSNDIVLIRAVYRHDFITPVLGSMVSGSLKKNYITHMATVVMKAEPYTFGEE